MTGQPATGQHVAGPLVRAGHRGDRAAAAAVLGRAFQGEPVYRWLLPDPARRQRMLPVLLRSGLTHLHRGPGAFDVATVADRVVGAAIWDPPGHRGPGLLRRVLARPGRMRAVGLARWSELAAAGAALAAAHPTEPHWYLDHLGADPQVPRCGAGAALLSAGLARADTDRVGTYLECREENLAYYRRFGFAPRALVVLEPGELVVHTMWRPVPASRPGARP